MIEGTPNWVNSLAALAKQPIYQLAIPTYAVTLTSYPTAVSPTGGPSVRNYWSGGNFFSQLQQSLEWMYNQQSPVAGPWNGNADPTAFPASTSPGAPLVPTSPALIECGIVYSPGTAALTQEALENIVMTPPSGQLYDTSQGPDGFPINESAYTVISGTLIIPVIPISSGQISAQYAALNAAYPTGNTICGTNYANPDAFTMYGYVYGLKNPITDYRVDLFSVTDKFYYQSSAAGTGNYSSGPCVNTPPTPSPWQNLMVQQGTNGYWAANVIGAGLVIAALYPTSVSQPSSGASFTSLPTGWIAHTNSGTGEKLTEYWARIYVKTDIEYLQEDNIPLIVQDGYHLRCGSSLVPNTGTPTVHIVYNDPVAGPIEVFDSLLDEAAYAALPRSFIVPTSDPLYEPTPIAGALQNRSFSYDCALAIIGYSLAGNFRAAAKVIYQLNALLAAPGYLASIVLENGAMGSSSSRWTKSNSSDTVTDVTDSTLPPYGGTVVDFTALVANDTFTYSGSGFPDTTDAQVSWQHKEVSTVTFVFDISVTTNHSNVTDILVTSGTAGPATYNSSTKQITVPIGPGSSVWRTTLVNLQSLISSLVSGESLASITGFKITLTATGSLYLNNLSLGTTQPAGSINFSFDVLYGQVDQAYIRAGTMAWLVYAYAYYMQLSGDYTPTLSMQEMINFIETLKSSASDLTNSLYYLGYGKYINPGYQLVPGIIDTVSTEHNIDIFYAWNRAAAILPAAASALYLSGQITSSQQTSLNATATTIAGEASTIWIKLSTNLYIAPSGGIPGHFGQGVTGSTVDPSYALDASGYLGALIANDNGNPTIALQCLEFVYQTFLVTNQTIALSSSSSSWNEAYSEPIPFIGMQTYQNGTGGYSGVPVSVWQEGTWGTICALLRCYAIPGLSTFFAGTSYGSIDNFISALVNSQQTIWSTTGDGSLLGYSLASVNLPWEFEVWPMLAATAWFWIVSTNPNALESLSAPNTLLDAMIIPGGQSQTPDELNGTSSIGTITMEANDPSGVLKSLAAQDALIGQFCPFSQTFPGAAASDTVQLHLLQVTSVNETSDARISLTLEDPQRFIAGQEIWTAGGPLTWSPGFEAVQPVGEAWLYNGFPVSNDNPRFVQGNPIDVLLATLQNELGVGQDAALFDSNYVMSRLAPIYDSQQSYEPIPYPPNWAVFQPGNGQGSTDSTLINPNPYINVPGFLNLRNTLFSGDWLEFVITRPIDGKQFIEDQILKPLGLYFIVRANGQLDLKTMKPVAFAQPVFAFNTQNVIGIPNTDRNRLMNTVLVKTDVDNSSLTTAARAYDLQFPYVQQTSVLEYRQAILQQLEATGLRVNRGGVLRSFKYADYGFRRHAFKPPVYKIKAQLRSLQVELGDSVSFTHPLVLDFETGKLGVVNATCEVIDRHPDYSMGTIEFSLLDLRFCNISTAYQIAPLADTIPPWTSATTAEKERYMFISELALGGENPDGTPGNTIF
jgi:hypothetical protein